MVALVSAVAAEPEGIVSCDREAHICEDCSSERTDTIPARQQTTAVRQRYSLKLQVHVVINVGRAGRPLTLFSMRDSTSMNGNTVRLSSASSIRSRSYLVEREQATAK